MTEPPESTQSHDSHTAGLAYILRLFVAGDEPNSRQAKANLANICATHLNGQHQLEIVDVLEDFETALRENIIVTPALILVSPTPRVTILGNLNDTQKVLSGLRLTKGQ